MSATRKRNLVTCPLEMDCYFMGIFLCVWWRGRGRGEKSTCAITVVVGGFGLPVQIRRPGQTAHVPDNDRGKQADTPLTRIPVSLSPWKLQG